MSLASAFADLLTDGLSYVPYASTNANGEDQPGTAVSYSGRVQRMAKRITTAEGNNISSDLQVFLITADTLSARGWVAYAGETRRILKIDSYRDDAGTPFTVIYA